MADSSEKSCLQELTVGIVAGVVATVVGAFIVVRLGLDKSEPTVPQSTPAPPVQAATPPQHGSLGLTFSEEIPANLEVLIHGQPVLARSAGLHEKVIDHLTPGWCPVTVRSGERAFRGATHIEAGKKTTVDIRLPPAPRVEPRLVVAPMPVVGTLILDLPEDAQNVQVLLDGRKHSPAFTTRRALGFVVVVGVHEVRVRRQAREWVRHVSVREGTAQTVAVCFPRVRLLLEFMEDIPDGLTVLLNETPARPVSSGRRCCEFEVDPGTHSLLVQVGSRRYGTTVNVGERTQPVTVDLGPLPSFFSSKNKTPRAAPHSESPPPNPPQARDLRASTPAEVWREGIKLGHQRVRIVGLGKIYSALEGRHVIYFSDSRGLLVRCTVEASGGQSLQNKVRDGESRVITVEGTVHGTRQTTVEVGEGKVIWAIDPLDR